MSHEIRPASRNDLPAIKYLLTYSTAVHRHLDWIPPLDWLGTQPYVVMEENGKIEAALAFPSSPDGIAWVRLFACLEGMNLSAVFGLLLDKALEMYPLPSGTLLASMVLIPWYREILEKNGFHLHQKIVSLARAAKSPIPHIPGCPGLEIRRMFPHDVPAVEEIDAEAFEPLWQNPAPSLIRALEQSAYATVAEINDEIVGYQLSTGDFYSTHLARLAVKPCLHNQGIGGHLVSDLLHRDDEEEIECTTVNTQKENTASQALYLKLGFCMTGEEFSIYTWAPFKP